MLTLQCDASDFRLVWDSSKEDFSPCFLYLCMEMPCYGLLAIVSAYYMGKRRLAYTNYRDWNSHQSGIIYARALIVGALAIIPVSSLMLRLALQDQISLLESYAVAVKTLAWFLHLIHVLRLKRGVSFNTRGPKPIIAVWLLTALMSVLILRSRYLDYDAAHDLKLSSTGDLVTKVWIASTWLETLLQGVYFLTLIPGHYLLEERHYRSIHTDLRDTHDSESFLDQETNSYVGFNDGDQEMELGTAKENTGYLSLLFFGWVSPLLRKGSCGFLRHTDDLFDLPYYLNTSSIAKLFQRWNIGERKTLLRTLHICFGWEFYSIGLLKLLGDAMGFCGPLLLNGLVNFVETTNSSSNSYDGYYFVIGLFIVTLLGALFNAHFNMAMMEVNLKIKASLVTEIYRKVLSLRKFDLQEFTSGEIINFLSCDTARIVNACASFHAFWSQPLQVAIALYLLYVQIGISFLAGVIFVIVLIPINKALANKIGQLSSKMMKYKDARVNLMSEILYGVRVVKFHGWERFFIHRVNEIREKELSCLKGRKYLDAMCVYFWATTPVLVSVLSFTTYILLGNQLTAAKVFTSIALFNMLINPLNALPWVLNGVVEAWVSVKRLNVILNIREVTPSLTYSRSRVSPAEHIVLHGANFSWNKNEYRLQDLNLHVRRGQLIGVIGDVGSGKSSLLYAILNELNVDSGKIEIDDYKNGFGVVLQEPWIQRRTIRENILFGEPFNLSRYNAVLDGCCLREDLREMESGDDTYVGENGITLSGGQKARLSLARAVYQNKDVYLIDDIFSAVDTKVAKQLNALCIHGVLKGKTRLVCTHHLGFLKEADWIVVMDKGTVMKQGTPEEMLKIFYEEDDEPMIPVGDKQEVRKKVRFITNENQNRNNEETTAEGGIKSHVYKKYVNAVGYPLCVATLFFLFAMQASRNSSDFWLAHWIDVASTNGTPPEPYPTPTLPPLPLQTEDEPTGSDFTWLRSEKYTFRSGDGDDSAWYNFQMLKNIPSNIRYYFIVYVVIGIVNSFMTLGRAFFFAYGSIQGGKRMHKMLLRSVMKAKLAFFDSTPIGRIINRFSSDQGIVDDNLPFMLNILLAQAFGLLGTLCITSYAVPWILVLIAPLALVCNNIQKYYRHTSRQLRRLASVSLSPIYAHFSETLKGHSTIRGMCVSRRFMDENEDKVEANQKSEFATQAVSLWLNVRLQLVGVLVITGVGLIGIIQHGFETANSAMLGLAISYALTITNSLSSFVSVLTETEKEMVAVERVTEYIETVEPESTTESLLSTPYGWPSQGVISFNNVALQYRPDLPYVLKGVSFETRPHEKIGVVGRTGSGKSSLFQALFRMVDSFEGSISIDSVNTKNLNLKYLRKKLCIIPQDPLIFTGSVRENLDPGSHHRDETLWRAVEKCQLRGVVNQLGGLEATVGEGGSLLSVGQKQLLCLARALLSNPKILCIDEATANVDQETDKIIQGTIRSSFGPTTVITIAHRVNTILHYDRVLVMKGGEIIEFDCPQILLQNKTSYFYQLAHGLS